MKRILSLCSILGIFLLFSCSNPSNTTNNEYENIDISYPKLSDKTKEIILKYQNNPTKDNYNLLIIEVYNDYDLEFERQKSILLELTDKEEIAKLNYYIEEMQFARDEIVDELMDIYTDPNLNLETFRVEEDYLKIDGIMGTYISNTTVSNSEYKLFVEKHDYEAPLYWNNGSYPFDLGNCPVVGISYEDAVEYCEWYTEYYREKNFFLTEDAVFRLPTEQEWEKAAGEMPEGAIINCGNINSGVTSIYSYSDCRSKAGAIGMWGNVWEWTSSIRKTYEDYNMMAVKGGAFNSSLESSKTTNRTESKASNSYYNNVGFRMIKVVS